MMKKDDWVYVVDADSSVRRALKRLVMAFGINVRTFASIDEFVRSSPTFSRACLILDFEAGSDAENVQDALARLGDGLHVIVITVSDGRAARQFAIELNAVMCLQKPVDDQALLDSIRWSLSRRTDGGAAA